MSETQTAQTQIQTPQKFTTWKEMANYYLNAVRKEREEKLFYKHSYETEHEQYMAQNAMFRQLQIEFNSKFREQQEISKVATAEVLSDEAASLNISDVVRGKRPSWFRITWQVVGLVLGFLLIWQLAVNAEFRVAVLNPIVILLVVIAIVFGYLAFRQIRGRRR